MACRWLNFCLILAQVEHLFRKTPYLQPQSTVEPSSVSLMKVKQIQHAMMWFGSDTSAIPFFSSAVLYLPSRSCPGETRLPVHAEQSCAGLWRDGSLGSVCSWQLQCESHTCAKVPWRSRSVWPGDRYRLIGPIKWNSLNVQLCSNSK